MSPSLPQPKPSAVHSPMRWLIVLLIGMAAAPLHADDRAAIHKVPPIYPPLARQMHITGVIKVVAIVDPSGTVLKVDTDSGNKMLGPAAVAAVMQWKFAPGAVTSTIAISVNFEMQ